MKVVVIGGAGYLGGVLSERLLNDGHEAGSFSHLTLPTNYSV